MGVFTRWYHAFFGTIFAAGCIVASAGLSRAQVPLPAPSPLPATPTPPAPVLPLTAPPSGSPPALPSAAPSASPTPVPTQPPIVVIPAAAAVPVGFDQTLQVQSVLGPFTASVADPHVVTALSDQNAQTITLTGVAPGSTTLTITDQRGLTAVVPVRVAYNAGAIADAARVRITGDPASPQFVKRRAVAAAREAASVRPGAQIVLSADDVHFSAPLGQDDVATVSVPVLIQGNGYFSVSGTTQVRVENMAAPKIVPDSLMVSDFPEKLEENGVLFTADLKRERPSRFLYFHYNPPGAPDRRIVLRAQNLSVEPALVQFILGEGGPAANEMEAGHDATRRFLTHLVQNEGRIIQLPGNGTLDLLEQDLPAGTIATGTLQLRVLEGSIVHLTLFAQNAADSPSESLAGAGLLQGSHRHARGIYAIPEFHYSALWNVTDPYLELPIGQIPLPNLIQGEALSGDYGVLQTFVIKVQNPTDLPQSIAIYENPRGGRATGTFLVDGVLIQSHQVPPFSRYKIRQYVVPARGFVRVTIATIPDSGSSYPLKLIFAPDDGSVPPGAPGSPVY